MTGYGSVDIGHGVRPRTRAGSRVTGFRAVGDGTDIGIGFQAIGANSEGLGSESVSLLHLGAPLTRGSTV